MGEEALWHFIASAAVTPIVVPLVLLLIPWWRCSFRKICWAAAALEAALIAFCWAVYALLGPTDLAVWIVGTIPPIPCICLFIAFCELRDGRFVFLIVTLGMDIAICDSLSSIFASRGEWRWLLYKLLITLIVGVLIYLFCRKPLLRMLESNHVNWGVVSFLPLFFWMTLLGYYLEPVIIERGRVRPLPTVLLCCTAVIFYVALYHFQRAVREQAEIRQYNAVLQSELGFLQRQSQQVEAVERSVQIFRHDMRHYLHLLRGCIETDNRQTAEEILAHLEQNTEQFSPQNAPRKYTGNSILDMVLGQAAEQAEQAGISFSVQLTMPQSLRVDLTELAVVLSNALENAVHAASKEPPDHERVVRIESLPCRQELFLVISNSFTGTVQWDKETGLPRAEKEGHGYGTLSISDFAKRYGCVLSCVVREGVFYLRLLI